MTRTLNGGSAPGLQLGELCRELAAFSPTLTGSVQTFVADLHQDSRRVREGDLFVARDGLRSHGAAHAAEAVAKGAAAVMIQRGAALPDLGVPVLEVDDVRRAAAFAAEAIFAFPTRRLGVVGITGTNGKTTTAWLASAAINGGGGRCGRIGTLGFSFAGVDEDSALTTPECDDLSRFAASIEERGATHVAMEVSSHALDLGRVAALRFAVAAFTNLSQDHLDYHVTMDRYAASKRRLFEEHAPQVAVLNVDDAMGRDLAASHPGRTLTVSRRGAADVMPRGVQLDASGIRGQIQLPSGTVGLETRLVGEHNLDNVLLCLGIVEALGLDVAAAAASLSSATQVPGRLERCDQPHDDVVVLVDYAHTPDALARVLATVRGLTARRVTCVFGCGGDRDAGKRPHMGEVVGRLADYAIVTNDNPRSERPEAIAAAVEEGLRASGTPYQVMLDRAAAIEHAVLAAEPGDVVLLAGKGHEPYQIVGGERRAFDDRDEARRALARRRKTP
jgi:UDP-N-acetylmuramoyl-L-alanyl-D-glutamate--2,6-diaminopimelate ligase